MARRQYHVIPAQGGSLRTDQPKKGRGIKGEKSTSAPRAISIINCVLQLQPPLPGPASSSSPVRAEPGGLPGCVVLPARLCSSPLHAGLRDPAELSRTRGLGLHAGLRAVGPHARGPRARGAAPALRSQPRAAATRGSGAASGERGPGAAVRG